MALERTFEAYGYNGRDPADAVARSDSSHGPALTAPHATNHLRRGKIKRADRWTGGLVRLVGERTGAATLVATGASHRDLSWDDDFARHLRRLVPRLPVIDVHGMLDDHGVDVCLGTAGDRSDPTMRLVADLAEAFDGFSVSIDEPFDAAAPYTVTSFVQSRGGVAVQLELAARLRSPDRDAATADRVVEALTEVAKRDYRWLLSPSTS